MLELIEANDCRDIAVGIEQLEAAFIAEYPYYSTWVENIKCEFATGKRTLYKLQSDEHCVGYILIHFCAHKSAKLNGLLIFEKFRGNGYANKALDQLLKQLTTTHIEYIFAQCRIENNAMIHLFHKFDFNIIGTNYHTIEKAYNWLGAYNLKGNGNLERMVSIADSIYANFKKYGGINASYEDLIDNIISQLSDLNNFSFIERLKNPKMGIHLAICKEPYIQYMISGLKTIESRITKNKTIPFGKVKKDDVVILKRSSGPVLAIFTVKDVISLDNQTFNLDSIRENYQDQLCIQDDWWEVKKDAQYASLICIEEIVPLTPIIFSLEKNRQAWIIIRKKDTWVL